MAPAQLAQRSRVWSSKGAPANRDQPDGFSTPGDVVSVGVIAGILVTYRGDSFGGRPSMIWATRAASLRRPLSHGDPLKMEQLNFFNVSQG